MSMRQASVLDPPAEDAAAKRVDFVVVGHERQPCVHIFSCETSFSKHQ